MLIEAILKKKIEPIVLQTAGSTKANSVCISEGSFQNRLNYNKQKLRGGTLQRKDLGIRNEKIWLPAPALWEIPDF